MFNNRRNSVQAWDQVLDDLPRDYSKLVDFEHDPMKLEIDKQPPEYLRKLDEGNSAMLDSQIDTYGDRLKLILRGERLKHEKTISAIVGDISARYKWYLKELERQVAVLHGLMKEMNKGELNYDNEYPGNQTLWWAEIEKLVKDCESLVE